MSKHVDRSGERYSMLTVLERVGSDKHGNSTWLCECDCGQQTVASLNDLKKGKKSCGCLRNNYVDLTGKVFGRLTVIEEAGHRGNNVQWLSVSVVQRD